MHGICMPENVEPVPIAKGAQIVNMLPGMANRHGLIAGATGTGKTVTLRVLAENFSASVSRSLWQISRVISPGW